MTTTLKEFFVMGGVGALMILLILVFQDQAAALIDLMGSYSGSPLAIGVAILVFLIGSILLIPQWMLIAASIAAFGLVEGTGIAWLATMVATTIHVFAARSLEKRFVSRLSGVRSQKLRSLFQRHSVHAGCLVRLIPTGPAIVVNAAAGLFGVSRGGFLAGTAIGIIPKIILTGIVASELISSAQARQVSIGLAFLGFALLVWFIVLRVLRQRRSRNAVK
jgi:uncharacterized membrane protein YdjX (TVP38/TMEM64 family)